MEIDPLSDEELAMYLKQAVVKSQEAGYHKSQEGAYLRDNGLQRAPPREAVVPEVIEVREMN